jgi:glutathione S-transferase
MLRVYGHAKTRAFRVLWLLEELGLQYEHISLVYAKGEHRTKEFLRLNPLGKVPVLVDGDQVVYESAAIMMHLMEVRGTHSDLYIEPGSRRTHLYQWLFYGVAELEQGLWTAARHTFVLPPEKRIPAAINWGQEEFLKQLPYLSEQLGEKSYLLGGQFSIADILISQILSWATQQQKLPLQFDNLLQYQKRCTSRPCFQSLVARLREGRKPQSS